ncbi:MAG: VWA domain-containing protein [Candidatus Hydrogenedentes bacterium]|nr:VWA domain-containing protein [Candidatus Hydrogenedentota bacterium]
MIFDWLHFDTLRHPLWLCVGLVPLLLLLAEVRSKSSGVLEISTGAQLRRLNPGRRAWRRHIPAVLRCLGLLGLVVALAGPLDGFRVRKERADVVDIMLFVDVSASMGERDFHIGTEKANRLEVTKIAVANFIENRRIVPEGRFGVDRLGLIFYAGIAWTGAPLTLDYVVLEHEIERAKTASNRERHKNGTAIGSAIGLAVRRLSKSEAKSKVIILLTDGMNNRNELDPITAAHLAKAYGIKIYTLGVGPLPQAQRMGRVVAPAHTTGDSVDEAMLKRIAKESGGGYYRATDTASLEEAYAAISALEATDIEAGDVYEYDEAHVPWILLAALMLGGAVYSRRIWFEVLP